jgi:hypothetical protein
LTLGKISAFESPSAIPENPMNTPKVKIVADGERRYREAKDYDAIRTRVLAEVSRRFESEKAKASFWRRCWLEVRIRREVRALMKLEFPMGSLHISSFQGKTA